jgi:hypothetical protein
MVVHPFGFTFNDRVHKDIPSSCFGVRRVSLPEEVRELARAAWPASHPRYWTIYTSNPELKGEAVEKLRHAVVGPGSMERLFEGHPMISYMWGTDVADFPQSIPTRAQNGRAVPVFYPIVSDPYGKPFLTPERLASNELYFDVDTSPDRHGFLGCYMYGSYSEPFYRDLVGDMDQRTIVWRIGGERVFGQLRDNPRGPVGPQLFFEADKFWFTGARDGL